MAGADAVKFQIWKTENVITQKAPLAKYQKTKKKNSLYQLLKKLELPYSSFKKIHMVLLVYGYAIFDFNARKGLGEINTNKSYFF